MRILKEREVRRAERTKRTTYVVNALEPEEREHARTALRQLVRNAGSVRELAVAMSVSHDTLKHALERNGKRVSAGLALRAARYAGAPVEELLSGAWPKPRACPMCGRE